MSALPPNHVLLVLSDGDRLSVHRDDYEGLFGHPPLGHYRVTYRPDPSGGAACRHSSRRGAVAG